MKYENDRVKIHGCTAVWDAITRPDKAQDGTPKYSLKVVVDPNNPDMADMHQLANSTLQTSKFNGVLPPGSRMPIGTASPTEFNGLFPGFVVLNCNTRRLPDVYDELGAPMEPMQYGPVLYPGQRVDVLVHCYEYDSNGNRGIATGLDAFSVVVSAQAPRQDFGGGGIDTSAAFGGQPPAQQAYQPPAQQPQQAYQPPAQQAYQPPAQQAYQPPAQQAYQPPAQQGTQQQYPAQSQGFLPPQQ